MSVGNSDKELEAGDTTVVVVEATNKANQKASCRFSMSCFQHLEVDIHDICTF